MTLGEKICKLRTEKKMSQGDLADVLEVSRQSISKWETNGSVPELDKLVKLSEIFGISLDELILDRKQAEQAAGPEPKIIYVEQSAPRSAKKTAGVILLCFAALVWLVVSLFGDILAGLVLAIPFVACGSICLFARKNVGLWCIWVVYLFIELYLRFATGVSWQFVLLPHMYAGGWTIHLIVAWALWSSFAALTIVTVLRFRKASKEALMKNVTATIISWVAYGITWISRVIPAGKSVTETSQIAVSRVTTSIFGWLQNIILVVAIVFTVRVIMSFRNKSK